MSDDYIDEVVAPLTAAIAFPVTPAKRDKLLRSCISVADRVHQRLNAICRRNPDLPDCGLLATLSDALAFQHDVLSDIADDLQS